MILKLPLSVLSVAGCGEALDRDRPQGTRGSEQRLNLSAGQTAGDLQAGLYSQGETEAQLLRGAMVGTPN